MPALLSFSLSRMLKSTPPQQFFKYLDPRLRYSSIGVLGCKGNRDDLSMPRARFPLLFSEHPPVTVRFTIHYCRRLVQFFPRELCNDNNVIPFAGLHHSSYCFPHIIVAWRSPTSDTLVPNSDTKYPLNV